MFLEDCDRVKQVLFAVGAGKLGNYDCCAWQTMGQGQFRPLARSDLHIGKQNLITEVTEYKVEIICANDKISNAINAFL